MYRLHFQDRALRRAPFETREPYLTIGRGADCRLCLSENGVSAQHALIERRDDGYHVRDLGSANGVRVNGLLVKDERLATGDELEVGSVRMRFEIVHERPSHRRTVDMLQVTAAVAIFLLMAGQIALLGHIFATPRARQMRTDGGQPSGKQQTAQTPAAAQASPSGLLQPLETAGTPPPPLPLASSVLPRMIKITRVDRTDASDQITLRIQVKAQVGERELDANAVAISAEFVGLADAKVVSVNIPMTWENFSTKTLVAHGFGAVGQVQGYIVRTYYHKQLQDVVAAPQTLLNTSAAR